MKFQVREKGVMSDTPMSELYDTYEEAKKELDRLKETYTDSKYFRLYVFTNFLA